MHKTVARMFKKNSYYVNKQFAVSHYNKNCAEGREPHPWPCTMLFTLLINPLRL